MAKEKPEKEETPNDEAKESLETQETEKEEGTEEHDSKVIPEEFQNQVHSLISEYADSRPCLSFMRNAVSDAEMELTKRENEEPEAKKGAAKVPSEYSTAGMPE